MHNTVAYGHSQDDDVYKILNKMKKLWQNQLKISVWFYSKLSIEVDIKI